MTEISINKALQQTKLLDKRIQKALATSRFAGILTQGCIQNTTIDKPGLLSSAAADYTSLMQLIDNRAALRAAINASNSTTSVEFFGKTYTVFGLLELKQSIQYWQQLSSTLATQESNAISNTEYINDNVMSNVQNIVEQRQTSSGQVAKDFIDTTTKQMLEVSGAEAVIPLKEKREELDKTIDDYLAELDFTLTEINALTKIKVEI